MQIGSTVRMHPASDYFMMGILHATVMKVGHDWIYLWHPPSGKNFKIPKCGAERYFLRGEK